MRKRLNDTAALVAAPSGSAEASHSISSEKIDNGYLVRQSRCDPATGAYSSTCHFSKSPPRIIPGRLDGRSGVSMEGPSGLRDAMDSLK